MQRREALLSIGAIALIPASELFADERTDLSKTTATEKVSESKSPKLILAVMDPLSDRLACDCVKGYAQRKYDRLAELLVDTMECQVQVVYGDTIASVREKAGANPDLFIGKFSVIKFDAAHHKISVDPLAMLTDREGKTTQTGLVVVRGKDSAMTAKDLRGYQIYFGPEECDEKSAAPAEFLKSQGVALPEKLVTSPSCTKAVTAILEAPASAKVAAVISSYAQPLLEGCGTVEKGAIRVVGQSAAVPFIGAFASDALTAERREIVLATLLAVGEDSELCRALESKSGFVAIEPTAPVAKKN